MNYEIHIEDLENIAEPLVLHYSERGTINLNWMGGDDKTQPIVGCELNFTLEVYGGQDSMYGEYFTTNEKRFRVTKYIEGTDTIVYRGFLLPESYNEPYNQQLFYVDFSAVDGLGLLKGETMPEDFYEKEHFVTDVIAQILDLTQIGFNIYLAPAIRNHLKKKWHEIVIDGRKYFDEDKPPSAYEILEDILHSMRCVLFQSEGRWYIEGINFRHLRVVAFDTYDPQGNYLGTFDVEKNIKKVSFAPTPNIAMVPGLKEVTVTHEAAKLTLSSELYQETKIDWVRAAGVLGVFNPRNWLYSTYLPKVRFPEYYLEFPTARASTINPDNYIELRDKPFVLKGTKVRIRIAFQLLPQKSRGITSDEIAARRASGIWIDMMVFKILLNDTTLYYNLNTDIGDEHRLVFDGNLNANAVLEFVAQENGYLNIQLLEPKGLFEDTLISAVRLTELKVEDIDQKENSVYTEIINEDASAVRDIELAFSNDVSLESKSFYLEKVRDYRENEGPFMPCPILYGRSQGGKNYSFVSVESAVLIEQFPEFVTHNNYFDTIEPPTVIYNLNGGEEMAIETGGTLYSSGTFYVRAKPYKPTAIDRTEWLKWSDAVYNVEQKPYAQVVAEIEGKLFKDPHLMVEATVYNPIKFNDLIYFKYNAKERYFVPSSVNWNTAENEASVTLIEGFYAGNSFGEIPPYVDAGPDLFLAPGETSVQITEAVATAPNGYIETLLWEKLSGDAGESYSSNSALNPLISGLTGNSYEFRLTATDNLGTSASDTMRVIRRSEYEILYTLLDTSTVTSQNGQIRKDTFKVEISPNIPAEETVNFSFKILFDTYLVSSQDSAYGTFKIKKNGVDLHSWSFNGSVEDPSRETENIISYNSTDNIELYFEARVEIADTESAAQSLVRIDWEKATFVNGVGSITNLTAPKEISADI